MDDRSLARGLHVLGRSGIFAEPSAAAGLAGLAAGLASLDLRTDTHDLEVVVLVTGSGARWPDSLPAALAAGATVDVTR
ncbi:hypothetical protein RB608_12720 [Nocardioides sp. LHD-245]|uniref:hypothetical protein n=1 Tax=Nocardioides sp. LHD-245 TaxID=3051387 RepID=UPI0027DF31B6|nr:hypothetical protein [Nocardioides sp. LHD-245]